MDGSDGLRTLTLLFVVPTFLFFAMVVIGVVVGLCVAGVAITRRLTKKDVGTHQPGPDQPAPPSA